jgi:hypothetical protein
MRECLINAEYAVSHLTKDAKWNESHGANNAYLGGGMLYYVIPYMHKSRVCVCLGSGGGFVPRMMAQAHRDLRICGAAVGNMRVILVDGNCGVWGRPDWMEDESFFRTAFSEIDLVIDTTANAFKKFLAEGLQVDYLHVDADHSFEGCLADLRLYLQLVKQGGIITLHDTAPDRRTACADSTCGVLDAIAVAQKEFGLSIVNFPNVGCGIMIARKP